MSNLQKTHGKYLWWALVGLGFQPDAAISHGASKANVKHINLGPSMFDRPNKDAFFIVTHFLLEKLNPTRFHDDYRYCWPILDHKADAEFRKVTCAWLRDIMDGSAGAAPRVVASLFLSPGGPKFTNLMLHLAKHVMLQEMKTCSTDGTWVPEAAGNPASSLDTARKRLQLVQTRFVSGAVDQDRVLQEYQKQAQCQVKSLRDRRAEDAKYDDLLKHINKDTDRDGTVLAQKIQKVRSLWSAIEGMLSTVEKERRVVECVVRGDTDQYTLDGNDLTLKVPPVLLQRIERFHHQEGVGSLYEAGQMNLLSLLKLLHHAVRLLAEERSQAASHAPGPPPQPQSLLEKSLQVSRAQEDLRRMRKKISKEEIPEMKSSIRMLEEDWDRKWAETLKGTPLTSFLNEDLALGFLSPMAPLSFEPATEASFRSSIFSHYPAKLLEFPEEEPAEFEPLNHLSEPPGPAVSAINTDIERTEPLVVEWTGTPLSTGAISSPLTVPLRALADSPLAGVLTPPDRAPSPAPLKAIVSESALPRPKHPVVNKNSQLLDWECDNLADQFSEAVTTGSGGRCVGGWRDLGSLLSTLATDPFSTRKQLPRTPESLLRDVRSSWRKAVEEDEAQKSSPSSIIMHFTPLSEVPEAPLSPDAPAAVTPPDPTAASRSPSPPPHQQGASLMSFLSWDSSHVGALHSLSGDNNNNSSSGGGLIQFSVAHETLPDLPCGDSLLSHSDGFPDSSATEEEEEEEEELLLPHIPSMNTETEPAALAARQRLNTIQQACREASFMDTRKIPEPSPRPHRGQLSNTSDWLPAALGEAATTAEAVDEVFSLDLDTLDSPSRSDQEHYSLPNLISFSPIDDM